MDPYVCPCGFTGDADQRHAPLAGGCCNCGSLRCMACVFREIHETCQPDCPSCCLLDSPVEGYVPRSFSVCPLCALDVADPWLAAEHVCIA